LLLDRNINSELRSWGVFADQQKKQNAQSVKSFADNLDKEIKKKQVI